MAGLGDSVGAGAALGSVVPGIGTVVGAVGGGLANILGGIIGGIASSGQRQQAYDAINKANDIIQQLGLPASQATPIILQQLQQAGISDPQLLQNVAQATTAYNNIAPDTSSINAQQKALQALQERGTVGLNAEDRLAMQQIRNQVGADAEGRRKQILQQMQAMGQGGGGAALAAQLQAAQAESNTESQQANQQAATAAQRALQAIQASAGLAGDIRNQNYNQASNKAAAQDQMNRFNVTNQYNTNAYNTQAQNAAQLYNAQNLQNISNANTMQNNAELQRQKQGQQTDFANTTGLASLKANSLGNVADMYQGQAKNTGQMVSGIASGVAGGFGSYGQYLNDQATAQQKANDRTQAQQNFEKVLNAGNTQPSYTQDQLKHFLDIYGSKTNAS